MNSTLSAITAALVPDGQRMNFLPRHFARLMLKVEQVVFSPMREPCDSYDGALWAFYDLSSGGAFLAPVESKPRNTAVRSNDYQGEVSAEAAGNTVALFALSHLAFRHPDEERLSDRFHQLRDFAGQHIEASAIFATID